MNIYEKFGLRLIINASGKMTNLGASAVNANVAQALSDASMDYVDISELMIMAGKVIAKVTGAEDGCPTTGAAAGIAISVASVIAGDNLGLLERLPYSDGLKNEIILQKGHAIHFGAGITQMIALGGGKAIEAGQANRVEKDHITSAITVNTAALLYVKSHHAVQKGMQSLETMLEIAKEHGLPLIMDAAAEEDLKGYVKKGVDLVIYSGGKAIGGPTSGLICGRASLVKACRAQFKGIARPMKVGKEAIMGLLTALQQYDEKVDSVQEQLKRMQWLVDQFSDTPGIKGSIIQDEAGREIYRGQLSINKGLLGIDANELIMKLESGHPAIFTRNYFANSGLIHFDPRPLLPGQEEIIVKRIKEIILERGNRE